jgi:hypothetical protein
MCTSTIIAHRICLPWTFTFNDRVFQQGFRFSLAALPGTDVVSVHALLGSEIMGNQGYPLPRVTSSIPTSKATKTHRLSTFHVHDSLRGRKPTRQQAAGNRVQRRVAVFHVAEASTNWNQGPLHPLSSERAAPRSSWRPNRRERSTANQRTSDSQPLLGAKPGWASGDSVCGTQVGSAPLPATPGPIKNAVHDAERGPARLNRFEGLALADSIPLPSISLSSLFFRC